MMCYKAWLFTRNKYWHQSALRQMNRQTPTSCGSGQMLYATSTTSISFSLDRIVNSDNVIPALRQHVAPRKIQLSDVYYWRKVYTLSEEVAMLVLFAAKHFKLESFISIARTAHTRMQAVSLQTASGRHTQLGMFALFRLSRSKLPDSDVLSQTTGTWNRFLWGRRHNGITYLQVMKFLSNNEGAQ